MTQGSASVPIAMDTMGGDLGPAEAVEGVKMALQELGEQVHFILVGPEDVLKGLLEKKGLSNHPLVSIHNASQVIEMDDKPKEVFKNKKDASMHRAFELLKSGEAKTMICCGNTKSIVFSGTLILRRMKGIERPALATVIPTDQSSFLLVDVGAEPESTPTHLVHNAVMGSRYTESVLGRKNPRLGLLTIGTEEGKGTKRTNETDELLKSLGDTVNYIGLIEGFDIFRDKADVVVCDGFTGNILLKSLEECAKMFNSYLKRELKANPLRMMGAGLSKGAFDAFKEQFKPEKYAGAPLLGLQQPMLKTHGSSDCHSFKSAILIALKVLSHQFHEQCEKDIEKANTILKAQSESEN